MRNRSRGLFGVVAVLGAALFLLFGLASFATEPAVVPAFGPEKFVRGPGAPQPLTRTFAAPRRADNSCKLLVLNGVHSSTRVASATLALNGAVIVGPADFNSTPRIEKPVTLQPQNTLTIELNGKPGSFILVSVVCPIGGNTQPVADAGPDQTVSVKSTVQLDGSASRDPDGDRIGYGWILLSKPFRSRAFLSNPLTAKPTFVADLPGQYVAQLIVFDGRAFSAPDKVTIKAGNTTTNRAPTITSTPIASATAGESYRYQVTATDPDAGDALTYSLTTKPDGMVINPVSGLIDWAPAQAGKADVGVRVQDTGGLFAEQTFTITVAAAVVNQAPQVNAGGDQTITLPATASLFGTVTDDGLPNPPGNVTVTWSQISGPGTVNFATPHSGSTMATFSTAGVYVIQLAASDGQSSASATATITVNNSVLTSTTQHLGPAGGSIALPNFGSATFPANAFSTDTAVSIEVTRDPGTAQLFDEMTVVFHPAARMAYELRVNTGTRPPLVGPVQVELPVPPELLAQLTQGYQPAAFAQIHMDGGEEVIDNFELVPSDYDPATQAVTALLPAYAFTDQWGADGTFEAVVTLGLVPAVEPTTTATTAAGTKQQAIRQGSAPTPQALASGSASQCPAMIACPLKDGCSDISRGYSQDPTLHPKTGALNPHNGVDFRGDKMKVLAAADGSVELARSVNGYGNMITLRHCAGPAPCALSNPATNYAHLDSFLVSPGTWVKQGTPIAISDNTGGRSTGPHLHFEYISQGRALNETCLERDTHRECIKYQYTPPYVDPMLCIPVAYSGPITYRGTSTSVNTSVTPNIVSTIDIELQGNGRIAFTTENGQFTFSGTYCYVSPKICGGSVDILVPLVRTTKANITNGDFIGAWSELSDIAYTNCNPSDKLVKVAGIAQSTAAVVEESSYEWKCTQRDGTGYGVWSLETLSSQVLDKLQ